VTYFFRKTYLINDFHIPGVMFPSKRSVISQISKRFSHTVYKNGNSIKLSSEMVEALIRKRNYSNEQQKFYSPPKQYNKTVRFEQKVLRRELVRRRAPLHLSFR
jgi:hypothetical protein